MKDREIETLHSTFSCRSAERAPRATIPDNNPRLVSIYAQTGDHHVRVIAADVIDPAAVNAWKGQTS